MNYIENGKSNKEFLCSRKRKNIFLIGDSIRQGYFVHFNCGHWDVAKWNGYDSSLTSEEEYGKNIKMIITLIKEKFVNARIVFATTTTMNPANLPCLNFRDNTMIDKYNEIAVKVVNDNGVVVNDLNYLTRNWKSDSYRDYCHFTEEASSIIGKAVADKLRKIL